MATSNSSSPKLYAQFPPTNLCFFYIFNLINLSQNQGVILYCHPVILSSPFHLMKTQAYSSPHCCTASKQALHISERTAPITCFQSPHSLPNAKSHFLIQNLSKILSYLGHPSMESPKEIDTNLFPLWNGAGSFDFYSM